MTEPDRLLSVAESIADGAPVSWSEEALLASRSQKSATFAALKNFEALLTALREVDRRDNENATTPPPRSDVVETPPVRWRHLAILDTIGHGSFGTVYRAHDDALGVDVALKLLSSSATAQSAQGAGILEEARLLARVRHPNVVRVYGVDDRDGRAGLWMEFVKGRTLEEVLRTQGPFSAHEAAIIGRDLCRAMAAVHQAGVLHGDIKAHNVVREAGGRTVLMDFGAGQTLADQHQVASRALTGTPVYLAPEVLNGSPRTASSDIYALGVLLYHLVTGSYPVDGHSVADLVAAHRRGERRHLRDARPDLPDDFVRAVEQAVAADPARRFTSLGVFEDALARVTSPAPEFDDGEFSWGTRLREFLHRWSVPLAAAAVLALGVPTSVWLMRPRVAVPPSATTTGQVASVPTPASDASRPYEIEAAFFRAGRRGEERLQSVDRVAPGDALFLKIQASAPLHVYVVNEDEKGAVFPLFPLPGDRLTNPLPAGQMVTVPGTARWQVTTAGEREHFLVFANPDPLEWLDREFARLPVPKAGMPVGDGALPMATLERLRGVGGLTMPPVDGPAPGGLSHLFTAPLTNARERARGLWVRQLTVDNPVR